MKKINYVSYFRVFENKEKSIVISIGEYHEFNKCEDPKSLDVNNIIGNIFSFYKNTINNFIKKNFPPNFKKGIINKIKKDAIKDDSVNILIELDMTRCYSDPYSNLFGVCEDFLENKKKWKWTPIDIRNDIVFLPYLINIIDEIDIYKKIITEVEVYNLVSDFLLYKQEIYDFLQPYKDDNFFKKQILASYKKIKKIFKTCKDKTMLNVIPIGHLAGNILTALQDIYCVEFIKNDKINIIYTGKDHSTNMESFFKKNNYKIVLSGKVIKENCTSVDLDLLNKILLKFYSNKIMEIYKLLN